MKTAFRASEWRIRFLFDFKLDPRHGTHDHFAIVDRTIHDRKAFANAFAQYGACEAPWYERLLPPSVDDDIRIGNARDSPYMVPGCKLGEATLPSHCSGPRRKLSDYVNEWSSGREFALSDGHDDGWGEFGEPSPQVNKYPRPLQPCGCFCYFCGHVLVAATGADCGIDIQNAKNNNPPCGMPVLPCPNLHTTTRD